VLVLTHPTGNTFVRAALRAFVSAGCLHRFYTTIAMPPPASMKWLPARVRAQAARRSFDVPPAQIRTYGAREWARLAATALGRSRLTVKGAWASVDAVYSGLDHHVAQEFARLAVPPDVRVVYAYEDAAERTFLAARARGTACVYELPIAHWQTTQRLLREEAARLPEWRCTLGGIDDPLPKLQRKSRELDLADVVVVPSRFVLESLPEHVRSGKPCVIAPFGSPPPEPREEDAPHFARERRLRVLFAGSMTQRKGLADLFAAMRMLGGRRVELVVMGSPVAPLAFYRNQYPAVIHERPRPHSEVLRLMRSCDVLALPAIVEGRALVQQEALACGLPLIVTSNAGADDLIEEGNTGFIVPIRSPEAIADRIAWIDDRRDRLPEMRRHAQRKAAETSWRQYEARLIEAVAAAGIGDEVAAPDRSTWKPAAACDAIVAPPERV
jgi:glycosyltransferase involved in cell wall biosynthesis